MPRKKYKSKKSNTAIGYDNTALGYNAAYTSQKPAADAINPAHYRSHPSGIECIVVTEHFNFNRGNAIKYIWRADEKGSTLENLRKAQWYLNREISRLEQESHK